jgi:hypothetical protein
MSIQSYGPSFFLKKYTVRFLGRRKTLPTTFFKHLIVNELCLKFLKCHSGFFSYFYSLFSPVKLSIVLNLCKNPFCGSL